MNRIQWCCVVGSLVVAACGPQETNLNGAEGFTEDGEEIVGGVDTRIAEHPFQIALTDDGLREFCGGSILSASWVITANHCVDDTAPFDLRVVAGASKRSNLRTGQVKSVSKIVRHPGFKDSLSGNDVALLKLASPLNLSRRTVKAIQMVTAAEAQAGMTTPGTPGVITGWGTLESGGEQPDVLQAATVNIVDQEVLKQQYPNMITDDMMGASAPGKDSCQGDSGGPLTIGTGANRKLAGIVSWGEGCALPNFAGVYARASFFESWAKEVMRTGGTIDPGVLLELPSVSVAKGAWKRFTVTVPEGVQQMTVLMHGGLGDSDLYVRRGAEPTLEQFDCAPIEPANIEKCKMTAPAAGVWHIGIHGYTAASSMELRATIP